MGGDKARCVAHIIDGTPMRVRTSNGKPLPEDQRKALEEIVQAIRSGAVDIPALKPTSGKGKTRRATAGAH